MANRIIFTTYFRANFPHLAEPRQPKKPGDVPKFDIGMMFPETGVCPINNQASSHHNIQTTLDEVCQEQWGLTFEQATAPGMGINFPPNFKNGNTVFEKDATGNPIPGKINPNTVGMTILNVKNAEPVGVVGADGTDIHAGAIYSGCWCRAQVEVSAYEGNNGRVVAIKLLNVQMCYDDTRIGGRAPTQTAAVAFAGMNVTDTNIPTGTGQTGAMPAAAPVAPQQAPQQVPVAPQQVPVAAAPANTDPVVMKPGLPSYAEMVAQGWTADTLVQHGHATPNYLNPVT